MLAGAVSGQGIIEPLFQTGFEADEDPAYVLGDLHGQNGWMVTPGMAIATVQDELVRTGLQAVSLVDGASYGRAQQGIATSEFGPVLMSTYEMYVSTAWATIPDEVLDRFEAHQRLEFADQGGIAWGVEFGLITTSIEYEQLLPGQMALYIEMTSEDTPRGGVYKIVDPIDVLDGWLHYELVYDQHTEAIEKGRASLYVNGEFVGSVGTEHEFVSLNVMQLENQRWGSSPNNNEALYFDDLSLGPAGCLADVNGDGVLDVLDFVFFQQLWVAQDPGADCDGNGQFNVLDFVCYSTLFQAGCEF
jgi:hypothetical protein